MITNELIRRCQQKERVAQKQLYSSLLPYLNVVCRRYLNDSSELQDTLQEVFIKIFTKIGQHDSQRSQFKTWAVKIAINTCLKNNGKSAKLITTAFVSEEHSLQESPAVFSKLLDEDLLAFFKTMPTKYFVVFNLHVIDGFSHKEIEELLGINEALSRKRLSRAREWLNTKKGNVVLKDLGSTK